MRFAAALVVTLSAVAAGCASSGASFDPAWTEPLPSIRNSAGPAEESALQGATRVYIASLAPQDGPLELPPVEVRAGRLSEEAPVGENAQPEWTTRRRFAKSRVYVLEPGQFEGELWSRSKVNEGEGPSHRWQTELGVGLPHRFQVDWYHNFVDEPGDRFTDSGPQLEARWALAKWGGIPLNPALYGEYRWDYHGADKAEAKVLLGDTVAPRWHAAGNLVWEQQTSGDRETGMGASAAVSYSLLERRLGVGAELTLFRVTAKGARGHDAWEAALGPSVQWRINERMHLDIVPLFGLNRRSTDLDLFVVLGYDFGGGTEDRLAPTATKSR